MKKKKSLTCEMKNWKMSINQVKSYVHFLKFLVGFTVGNLWFSEMLSLYYITITIAVPTHI